MKPIIYVNNYHGKPYDNGNFWTGVKDRFKIVHDRDYYIDELSLDVTKILSPPNINPNAYIRNIKIARKFILGDAYLAPKTFRIRDYSIMTTFQKRIYAYSVSKSLQMILSAMNKDIKNACIVVYDASDDINLIIIEELSKISSYIVLISENLKKLYSIRNYIIANFGVSPIITNDIDYAINSAQCIVCSKMYKIKDKIPVWFNDNLYIPSDKDIVAMNDVTFSTQWETHSLIMSPEIIGAILMQMDEKDIDKALKYNGIYINDIRFNELVV